MPVLGSVVTPPVSVGVSSAGGALPPQQSLEQLPSAQQQVSVSQSASPLQANTQIPSKQVAPSAHRAFGSSSSMQHSMPVMQKPPQQIAASTSPAACTTQSASTSHSATGAATQLASEQIRPAQQSPSTSQTPLSSTQGTVQTLSMQLSAAQHDVSSSHVSPSAAQGGTWQLLPLPSDSQTSPSQQSSAMVNARTPGANTSRLHGSPSPAQTGVTVWQVSSTPWPILVRHSRSPQQASGLWVQFPPSAIQPANATPRPRTTAAPA